MSSFENLDQQDIIAPLLFRRCAVCSLCATQEKETTPISVRITPDQCSVLADSRTIILAVIARVLICGGLHLPAFRERESPAVVA